MNSFFDFHFHKKNKNGIYNLCLFEAIPQVFFSAGIHPKDIGNGMEEKLYWLYKTVQNKNCIAIGECGLDGLVGIDEKLQEKYFAEQLELANKFEKPVIIHCVRRFSQVLRFYKIAKTPLIIHGFNKKKAIAEELLDCGFYLSFGHPLLYNLSLQSLIREMPLEKLFLETDDRDFNIEELYQKTAKIKGISTEELEEKIKKNLENIL